MPASNTPAGTAEAQKMLDFLEKEFPKDFRKSASAPSKRLRNFGTAIGARISADVEVGIGIKPVSYLGTERLVHSAIDYAIKHKRKSVNLVHKGNIMKFTEGAFRDWGYQAGQGELRRGGNRRRPVVQDSRRQTGRGIVIKDAIADITLQQVLTRPEEFDVIATLNLNGDYLTDALAAQVGGIGIAPGGNINYITGHAIFEATHGTAPKYANQDMVNPGSVVSRGVMMFEYLGWTEVADLILKGLEGAIASKKRDLRFRPPDGRGEENQVLRVRRQYHRPHVRKGRLLISRFAIRRRAGGLPADSRVNTHKPLLG